MEQRCGLPPPNTIVGVQIHPIRLPMLLDWINIQARTHGRVSVMYANAHAINLAQHNPFFRAALNTATVVFCDGQGLRIGAALLGHPLPERFTPPDWIDQLVRRVAGPNQRVMLIGGLPGVAERAAARMQAWAPTTTFVYEHGYFTLGSAEERLLLERIALIRPQLLLIGMGMPRQELWLQRHMHHLPVGVAMTVGALFDYLAGELPRAPRWVTDSGFEWAARLVVEPQRLWRRYLLGNPYFFWLVLRQRLRERSTHRWKR